MALGYEAFQTWEHGRSWRLSSTYIVVEQSPGLVGEIHERRAPGMNHLAFHVGDRADVDRLVAECGDYAAYLENDDGFEVELCASATA